MGVVGKFQNMGQQQHVQAVADKRHLFGHPEAMFGAAPLCGQSLRHVGHHHPMSDARADRQVSPLGRPHLQKVIAEQVVQCLLQQLHFAPGHARTERTTEPAAQSSARRRTVVAAIGMPQPLQTNPRH